MNIWLLFVFVQLDHLHLNVITELWLCIICLKKTAVGYFPRNHRRQLLKWKCTLYPWWVIHYLLEQRQVFTDEYHYRLICPGDAIKKRVNSCLFKQYDVLGFVQHCVKVFSQPSFASKYFASKVQDFLVLFLSCAIVLCAIFSMTMTLSTLPNH